LLSPEHQTQCRQASAQLLNRQPLPGEKDGKKSLRINPDSGTALAATATTFAAERQINGVPLFSLSSQKN
jgi:hypothetical protein